MELNEWIYHFKACTDTQEEYEMSMKKIGDNGVLVPFKDMTGIINENENIVI